MESFSPRFHRPAQHVCVWCQESCIPEECRCYDPHKESYDSLECVDLENQTLKPHAFESMLVCTEPISEGEFLSLSRSVQEKVALLVQRLESLGLVGKQNYVHLPTVCG